MIVMADNLRNIVAKILEHGGSDAAEAELVADHLVRANLAGHDSHGVGMLPTYIRNVQAGLVTPGMPARLVKDDGAILVFDGDRGYGQRVATESMAAAINRCRETGVVVMALRNAHHVGRVGAYGEQCVEAGLVSLHFANVVDHGPLVAPFGGSDARFSTNPVCIAVPGTEGKPPLLLDMATSRIALGKVRVAMNQGKEVEEGMLIDSSGEPTTDPRVMFREPRGAILPFGLHKGYGLALAAELLAGVLTGGGTIQPENPRRGGIVNNMLTIVVDPRRLVDHAWMQAEFDAVMEYLKQSPPAVEGEEVMVAGDPERKAREARERDGIPIDPATWDEIVRAGKSVGFDVSLQ